MTNRSDDATTVDPCEAKHKALHDKILLKLILICLASILGTGAMVQALNATKVSAQDAHDNAAALKTADDAIEARLRLVELMTADRKARAEEQYKLLLKVEQQTSSIEGRVIRLESLLTTKTAASCSP